MYEYIKGTLVDLTPDYAVCETGGIGYRIFIPFHVYEKAPKAGSDIVLYLSCIYREDSQRLFGFLEEKERNFFNTLSNITGIGPKTALSIIGHMPLSEIVQAVKADEALKFAKIPGIGKKTAERMLIELKDKIKHLSVDESTPLDNAASDLFIKDDVVRALLNLGYHEQKIEKALQRVLKDTPHIDDLSGLIKATLQVI